MPSLTLAARGRRLKVQDVRAIADGKVWTGQQALSMKLIDQVADFQAAVADTAKSVGIKGEPTLVRPENHTVFPVFASSAEHWWADQPLYANYEPLLDHFRYPPVFAVAITPFHLLGLQAGGILWSWINLAVYAAGLHHYVRDMLPGSWTPGRRAGLQALARGGTPLSMWW